VYQSRALTLIAEEHPQSPRREGVPNANEIAGQARNDDKGSKVVNPSHMSLIQNSNFNYLTTNTITK
jgi:hypothetical protein